ncbi:hypothetical protein [Enterovibrio baiacu]|uniref:hypothetical protein n=1 Tax=Enterovibrio baiacu TaxID=2491023 RepID=UPI001011C28A|nr:hypothetical protein [Enterovibrio baiacu]MBE1275646.1 hypothetical protein [Enterovibrio baiacu]
MSNIDLSEKGLITFFDLEKCGYYRIRQNADGEPYDIDVDDMLKRLNDWLVGKRFQNTVPWGDTGSAFSKIYCQSYYRDPSSGDFVLVLIKSVGAENGGVKGIKFDSNVDSDSNDTVTSADGINAREVAWGQVMYYWFIPELNVLASIKFRDSVCDINGLSKYVREWVKYRCNKHVGEIKETRRERADGQTSVFVQRKHYRCESGAKDNFSFVFKFLAKQLKQKTKVDDFTSLQSKVTHLVFRSTISASSTDRRKYAKLMDKFLPKFGFCAPKVDSGKVSETRHYEVIVEEFPSYTELEEIFKQYNEDYDEFNLWDNVGLKFNGRSNDTVWLDKYVVKSEISMPEKLADKDTYSANQIMQKLLANRKELLSKVNKQDATDTSEKRKKNS